jgi:hypothetical protein
MVGNAPHRARPRPGRLPARDLETGDSWLEYLFAPLAKLVGVEFSGVRLTALSRPWFFAAAMSVMPWAIASDMPNSTNLAL